MSTLKVVYGNRGKEYFVDGKPVTKEEADAAFPSKFKNGNVAAPSTQSLTGWPWTSELSMTVPPSQIDEVRERNRRHGINVEYVKDEHVYKPVCKTRAERKALAKLEGIFDKNGGYGDA